MAPWHRRARRPRYGGPRRAADHPGAAERRAIRAVGTICALIVEQPGVIAAHDVELGA